MARKRSDLPGGYGQSRRASRGSSVATPESAASPENTNTEQSPARQSSSGGNQSTASRGQIQHRKGSRGVSNAGERQSAGVQRRRSSASTASTTRRRRSSRGERLSFKRKVSQENPYPHYTRGWVQQMEDVCSSVIPGWSDDVRDQFNGNVKQAWLNQGLLQDEIARLPLTKVTPVGSDGLDPRLCTLCQKFMSVGDEAMLFPCGDYFHTACATEALKDKNRCPRQCNERPNPRENFSVMHAWAENSGDAPAGFADNMSLITVQGVRIVFLRT